MANAASVVAFALLLVLHAAGRGRGNLAEFIEHFLRRYSEQTLHTDEGFFRDGPVLPEYDFVVVGSGPGGAVVANRLSEVPHWKVLLLEAGSEESKIVDVPIFVSYLQFTQYNWGYEAERQPGACLGLTGERCRWPRGKALGGTSSINYMIYTRGNRADYDLMADQGNVGWGYDDVLPYFVRMENHLVPGLRNQSYHGRGGPLTVDYLPYRTKLAEAFLEAGLELGYDSIDYNDGRPPSGFSYVQEMIDRGQRVSSAKAYLKPIRNRPNLHISTRSRVTRVLIDPKTKTAYGVEYVKDRRTRAVRARKEVVLSAGALGSPQLLMLSGIGPRSHLRELGIPVVQDLPVGQNLREHVSYCGLTFLVNQTGAGILRRRLLTPEHFFNFMNNGKGPYTLPGGVEALAYIHTKYNDDERGRPDMELIFASGSLTADDGDSVSRGIGVKDYIYDKTFRPVEGIDNWTVWPMILHPRSRGYMKLKSKNPWHWPLFYGNYFDHERDIDTIVEGIKKTIELSRTRAFQKYGTHLNPIPIPDCATLDQSSDEYWRCAVRQLTTTLHHQSGTCKMGPEWDSEAVVSPRLQVYGVGNLRVVDASIIPQLVTAHTTAPTYLIGEKGSDLIKETWLAESELERYGVIRMTS